MGKLNEYRKISTIPKNEIKRKNIKNIKTIKNIKNIKNKEKT